jgi:hypothetical protein
MQNFISEKYCALVYYWILMTVDVFLTTETRYALYIMYLFVLVVIFCFRNIVNYCNACFECCAMYFNCFDAMRH